MVEERGLDARLYILAGILYGDPHRNPAVFLAIAVEAGVRAEGNW